MYNGDALRFSPQVAALAMPQESEYKAASDGIANIGKVMQDQYDRDQTQRLTDLKIAGANEELKSKQFDNQIAPEKWDQEKSNYLTDRKKKKFDALKSEADYNAQQKKVTESGISDMLKGWLPKEAYTNADGMPDRKVIADTRAAFLASPEWKDKGHIVNTVFDSLESDLFKDATDAAKANKEAAEASTVIPKANADIAYKHSASAKNYAGARLDNASADAVPVKTAAYVKQVDTSAKNAHLKVQDLTKDRQKIVADGKLENMVPQWGEYDEGAQRSIINAFVQKGILPSSSKEVTRPGTFYDDTVLSPVYDTPAVAPKQSTAKSEQSRKQPAAPVQKDYKSEISRLLNK